MLWFKTILITILVPGIGVFLIPYYILKSCGFPRDYTSLQLAAGILLILIGTCGFVWVSQAFARFGKGTPAPFDPPKQFVARGLYRFVRNPMYLGALMVILGESILFSSWQLLVYGFFLFIAFHFFVVMFEEKSLENRFGEPYRHYLTTVPRWLPRSPESILPTLEDKKMYENLAEDYDRFVNWKSRLTYELPFIKKQISIAQKLNGVPLNILDAACGTGMHAVALAQLGHKVSAADLVPQMVEKVRQNALTAGVDVDFKTAGFGRLVDAFGAARFDLLLCLGNSLPHLTDRTSLTAALQDFTASLRPGGLVLIQNRNFDAVMNKKERWMEPQSHTEGDAEWIFQRFYDFEPEGLIRFNIVTLKKSVNTPWISGVISTMLRPQLQAELVNELSRAGFVDIQSYGSMEGEVFNSLTSGNLILTAVKK